MKKINKIFITLASIVSISSLPIVAAACDEKKTEEGAGANSGTKDQEDQTLPKDQKEQTPQKDQSNQTPPKNQKEQTPQKDQSNQTPPKNQKEQNTKKYRLPGLKDFLDKNNNKLFELVDKTSADEELNKLANEGALRIDNGKIKHHKDKGRGKNKKSRSRSSYKDVEHLKLNSKFGESNKVNTHGKNNENIGYNLGGNKKGIKISKEDNKIVLEWQLYFEDGTKDNKIYKQEIDLN
ncbi:variable surface lipoprotein [Metamycoplasma alkalescens]|uniref:Lipoprotein n=1 Tax=Metamycoplasma alkalescens TaxID=45363 RepID=A0A318U436_9BACT|nr:variable surface lipoprotein [Metamycoplasma alkalescens]PYF42206.1 hypothetical protein BCF88_11512 [Metamycoplasma alkalescens]SYV90415.1 lipoprotein [Metamycoplasma alkalescens]